MWSRNARYTAHSAVAIALAEIGKGIGASGGGWHYQRGAYHNH